jgi:hypothetical protein
MSDVSDEEIPQKDIVVYIRTNKIIYTFSLKSNSYYLRFASQITTGNRSMKNDIENKISMKYKIKLDDRLVFFSHNTVRLDYYMYVNRKKNKLASCLFT